MKNPFNSGVYRWFNKINGKSYVGSSMSNKVKKSATLLKKENAAFAAHA